MKSPHWKKANDGETQAEYSDPPPKLVVVVGKNGTKKNMPTARIQMAPTLTDFLIQPKYFRGY